MKDPLFLEKQWNALLSRDPRTIRKAFGQLDKQSQEAVLEHLQKMINEPGWHHEQVASARAALKALSQKG